ncbi:uncharacterized protein LOC126847125 [Adelges cooleyi]|uniref:uncharacterized protein LOC126847125 n=1 Tax=Adelges cooleyi TaxID=133065 RepID=UPI0021805FED|nr:uncharacterized protein LOC126847125 [Adelges cooleyi]
MAAAADMRWNCMNTKDDLLNMFSSLVDHDIIEMVIENRNNDLLMAYRDLMQITEPIPNPMMVSHEKEEELMNYDKDCNIIESVDWKCLSPRESPINRILYLISKGYKVMILMRGCPGSGKSYLAYSILNQCYNNTNPDKYIFSADKFFINKRTGRYCFDRHKVSDAHRWTFENVEKAIKCETTPVIVDNTNIEAWEMENYVKLSTNNGYWIEILEPNTDWAWNVNELYKRNVHKVPFNNIENMLHRYDHTVNVEILLKRFKLKYNKNNTPPKHSNAFKKYQLCEQLKNDTKKISKPPIEVNDLFINDQFKDLLVSEDSANNKINDNLPTFNKGDEDPWSEYVVNEKDDSIIEEKVNDYLSGNCSVKNEDFVSVLPYTNEAINVADKSINTYENDFLFMQVLEEIPSEEYSDYVVFGKNKDINKGNENVLTTSDGKLDKGTMTCNLEGLIYKPNYKELLKQFPENVCSLITELFDKCNGDIDWIVDVLVESGHDITKQQIHGFVQKEYTPLVESSFQDQQVFTESNHEVKEEQQDTENIGDSLNHNIHFQKIHAEKVEENKKGVKKKCDSKNKKFNALDQHYEGDILRKNIENKFVFGDSLYSEHVLKIKKLKEGHNYFQTDDDVLPTDLESSSTAEDIEINENNDEKCVQLVVDTSVLAQLCDYFGDSSSELSKTTIPMSVRLPEKFAEDLYYYLIANVPTDIINQEAILQDETLAKKLQEECKVENPVNASTSSQLSKENTFAAVLSKKLLSEKYKNLDSRLVLNVLRAKDYKFQEASDVLSEVSGINSVLNKEDEKIVENEDDVSYQEGLNVNSNHDYSNEAIEHAHAKQQFLNKAQQSISTKIHPAVTSYYLEKAEESKQNEKYAKTKALVSMLTNNENALTIDLHYLQVQEALLVLDLYLDNHITKLKKLNGLYSRGRQLTIITGRGKHSPKGIARIRPVVIKRLQIRSLTYMEPEKPGLIMVIIKKNSLLSSEL